MKSTLVVVLLYLIFATGCTFSMADEGKMWFEVGTRVEIGHSSSETAGEPRLHLELDKAVSEYLFPKDAPLPDLPPSGDGTHTPDPDGDSD